MHPVFVQTFFYMVVVIIAMVIMSFIQRGFFWKYLRVRLSFGRLILIKVRAINRDFYTVGKIQDSFLVFKLHKKQRRIAIEDKTVFYRSMGCNWVDMDEERNTLTRVDYTPVSGFDAERYNNLYLRALTQPTIQGTQEKIMFVILIFIAISILITLYLVYTQGAKVNTLLNTVAQLKSINQQAIQTAPI